MTNTTPQAAEAARLADEATRDLRQLGSMSLFRDKLDGEVAGNVADRIVFTIDRLRDLASRADSPVEEAAGLPMKMVIDPTIPAGEVRIMQDGKRLATITGLAVEAKPAATGKEALQVATSEAQKAVARVERLTDSLRHLMWLEEMPPEGTLLYTSPSAGAGVPQEAQEALEALRDDRDSWREQANARAADAIQFANERDAARAEVSRLTAERDAAFAMSRCECSSDEACANLARLTAERDAAREDARRLKDAGAPMANTMFNLAQRETMPIRERALLKDMQTRWDAAMNQSTQEQK